MAQSMPQLQTAFLTGVIPTPAVATPEAFAARAAIVEAVAQPKTMAPLVAALKNDGSKPALRAAARLEELSKTLTESPDKAKDILAAASALSAKFDGMTAAPGESVDLSALPTVEDGPSEAKALKKLKKEVKRVNKLQETLASGKTRRALVVIQGMDTAGKDGVIKHGMTGLNPAWTKVAAFKKPTPEEEKRPPIERVEKQAPPPGVIGAFNRSHWEDVGVPLALGTKTPEQIDAQYKVNLDFERSLAEAGDLVYKVFVHVSKKEQRRRLQARIDRPEKRWKFSMSDIETRAKWDDFQAAYGQILARSSPWWAPWRVVGADVKPTRDLRFTRAFRKLLEKMRLATPSYPELDGVRIPK
jgi:polyphosphate kinase 2 (PPK2 family)